MVFCSYKMFYSYIIDQNEVHHDWICAQLNKKVSEFIVYFEFDESSVYLPLNL